MDLLARIEAFRPDTSDDNWRALDALVQELDATAAALPTLLRVFERFPRHDGHGVFWAILHTIEAIEGYEPILVDHVTRTPTEMGITMLQRLTTANITHVGPIDVAALIASLAPRAPIIDYTIEPVLRSPPRSSLARSFDVVLAELERFHPTGGDIDWTPLHNLVDEIVAYGDRAVLPLLHTLDRFHTYDGFSPFWPIVSSLEALPSFPSALIASLKQAPTRYGVTLLLRVIARDLEHTIVDGVDIAAFAADLLSRDWDASSSDASIPDAPDL